jgi:DNA-directed RNA polymerase alpha subunit
MITKEEFLKAVDTINAYLEQAKKETVAYKIDLSETVIEDVGFSARARNLLAFGLKLNPFETKIKELSKVSRREMYLLRGYGKKSISEIIHFCEKANIKLLP